MKHAHGHWFSRENHNRTKNHGVYPKTYGTPFKMDDLGILQLVLHWQQRSNQTNRYQGCYAKVLIEMQHQEAYRKAGSQRCHHSAHFPGTRQGLKAWAVNGQSDMKVNLAAKCTTLDMLHQHKSYVG